MLINKSHPRAPRRARQQRGIVLMLAIVVLVAMSLAAVALMRSVLTGNKVAGNLAFQQAATRSADIGIETAVAWLEQNNAGTRLFNNINIGGGEAVGYFASRQDPGPTQNWDAYWTSVLMQTARVNTLPVDAAGNTVSYVIQRLCNGVGDPNTGAGCEASPATIQGVGNGQGTGGGNVSGLPTQLYYRITARVTGPRNTVGFVQAVVAL